MTTRSTELYKNHANSARQRFCAQVGMLLPSLEQTLKEDLSRQLEQAKTIEEVQSSKDAQFDLNQHFEQWPINCKAGFNHLLKKQELQILDASTTSHFELVSLDAMEIQLLAIKLATHLEQFLTQEWAHLKIRLAFAQAEPELKPNDVVRPEILAKNLIREWLTAGLKKETWIKLQTCLHEQLTEKLIAVYTEANRYLASQGILTEINLREHIIKSPTSDYEETQILLKDAGLNFNAVHAEPSQKGNEFWQKARQHANGVVGRLKNLLTEQVDDSHEINTQSSELQAALKKSQGFINTIFSPTLGNSEQNDALKIKNIAAHIAQQSQELKQATDRPLERASIEIVALMFQSILNEERISPTLRVWFARLQIPVLRLTLHEPDFFSSLTHPARLLIDRIGSCAFGFGVSLDEHSRAFEDEVKRIVQIIEQYPEADSRLFQSMHAELQKFLTNHLKSQAHTEKVVSVAQQLEQKETLSIQFTIELRKQLSDIPIPLELQDFLLKIWTDVMAVTAIKFGLKHEEMLKIKKQTTNLLWAASAKPSRVERSQLISHLPSILADLRQGMQLLGIAPSALEMHIKTISNVLVDAFKGKTETISASQMSALTKNLANVEDFLSEIDSDAWSLNEEQIELITGIDASLIRIITQTGPPPNEATQAWAKELQIGSWWRLKHQNQIHQLQFAWRSQKGQLCMFMSTQKICFLIQTKNVASYLEATWLVPVEQESLTIRATRQALEQLDNEPSRLL